MNAFAWLLPLLLLGSFAPPVKPASPPKDCFKGKWGNDFILCGFENVAKPGKGNGQKRKDEELQLAFKGNDRGEFRFYDCQGKKAFSKTFEFAYTATDDSVRIAWQGTPEEVRLSREVFQFRTKFRYTCVNDTLVIENLMLNTPYNGAKYFVRR